MPSHNKPGSLDSKNPSPSPNSADQEDILAVADDDTSSRAGKRKTKNATASQLSTIDDADKTTPAEQMGHQPPTPTTNPHSIIGQLAQTFPQSRKNNTVNDLDDVNATQKVSDQHTPPTDVWGRSPEYRSIDSIPGFRAAGSPPYEPGFSSRGGFNARSPPISPPLRKTRPVSYGNGLPPLPPHARMSTSPYSHGFNLYGSPSLPPHLPQQHFYGPHDVDLGVAQPMAQMNLHEPAPLKFAHLPGSAHEPREAVFLVVNGELNVMSYNGEKLENIGALLGVQGTIIDASFLTWSTSEDPFADYRPLVALTVHGAGNPEPGSPLAKDQNFPNAQDAFLETKVVVCSISKSCQVAELLRVPTAIRAIPGGVQGQSHVANLKVQTSGNYLAVSSGDSGEIFVFSIRKGKESALFECLGKYWTTIQPQLQRRDSSHGPASDADVSPADLGRGPDIDNNPIFSLNGRWLAFCPASTPSRRSIGAILGDCVVYNKTSTISAGTAPSRPLANCEVDSPDVDTFLSKVAKGFAQEAVRSAKWISEKGLQTWQSYWKKDTVSPNLPASSGSPPVYSPHLGMAQFPPTHAVEQQNISKDPDLVTILDLKLLQEIQPRKGTEIGPMTTFQPPGGCSFLSLMPNGLGLLTANRKGDVQYIWDLLQMKHVRNSKTSTPSETGCVRQIARHERLSPSTIVDVAWDGPTGHRFALLTKNRTIHIFDLPRAAFQWPPPPTKKNRPTSAPINPAQVKTDPDPAPAGGFFASAMSIAGRTQPMLANLRGRAPSMGGGITGIGASGIGLASTNGIRSGGRAVAAGLSKSLGAASETVTSLRHANQSRLYLKVPARTGMFCWQRRDGKAVLSILDSNSIKNYFVRMTRPREKRQSETVSVFDARKAVATKLPKAGDLVRNSKDSSTTRQNDNTEPFSLSGFWRSRPTRDAGLRKPHPLASAEIETNGPYQPFHSDRRVTISLYPAAQVSTNPPLSSHWGPFSPQTTFQGNKSDPSPDKQWVFGNEIQSRKQNITPPSQQLEDEGSVIYRETTVAANLPTLGTSPGDGLDDGIGHIVSNTRKKKGKKARALARALEEEEEAGESSKAFPNQDAPFDMDDGLLEPENQF